MTVLKGLREKLKKARLSNKLTLEKLADSVGSSKSYMWQLENRPDIKPSAEMLDKIAKALDITVNYLSDPEMKEITEEQEALVFFRSFKDLDKASKQMIKQQIEHLKKLQKDREQP